MHIWLFKPFSVLDDRNPFTRVTVLFIPPGLLREEADEVCRNGRTEAQGQN